MVQSHTLRCARCRREFAPLNFRYLWVGWNWRGRGQSKPAQQRAAVLCGPCGDLLERDVDLFLLGAGVWNQEAFVGRE
jgi:hypothetical protein